MSEKESTQNRIYNGVTTVGTTRVRLTDNPTRAIKGVLIKADRSNTGDIYVGGPEVTANNAVSTGGMILDSSETVFIAQENAREIYIVASGADQIARWILI